MTADGGWWWISSGARVAAIAASLVLLAGCGGGEERGAGANPPVVQAAIEPTPTPVAIRLSAITWTTAVDPGSGAPRDAVTAYPATASAIIAAVQLGSVPAGEVLTATWSIDGVDVPEATMQTTAPNSLEQGWATFKFTREEGHLFPLGHLEVRITASSGGEVAGEVDIVLP